MITRLLLTLCLITTAGTTSTKLIKDSAGRVPPHPEPCVLTCAGSTGAGITNWHVGGHDRIYTEVGYGGVKRASGENGPQVG